MAFEARGDLAAGLFVGRGARARPRRSCRPTRWGAEPSEAERERERDPRAAGVAPRSPAPARGRAAPPSERPPTSPASTPPRSTAERTASTSLGRSGTSWRTSATSASPTRPRASASNAGEQAVSKRRQRDARDVGGVHVATPGAQRAHAGKATDRLAGPGRRAEPEVHSGRGRRRRSPWAPWRAPSAPRGAAGAPPSRPIGPRRPAWPTLQGRARLPAARGRSRSRVRAPRRARLHRVAPTTILARNRSSRASGRGKVPSMSIGFWVARTENGPRQRVPFPSDADRALLHGLEERRLRARRRTG